MDRRLVFRGMLGLAAVMATPLAIAKGRARFRGRGLASGSSYKGPVMTRAQLAQCVQMQRDIDSDSVEVEILQADLRKSESELNALEAQIRRQEAMLDRYSQESVDSYNRLVARHRRLVQAHNAKLPEVNAVIDRSNGAVERFNAQCAEKSYYESDMQAVLNGR